MIWTVIAAVVAYLALGVLVAVLAGRNAPRHQIEDEALIWVLIWPVGLVVEGVELARYSLIKLILWTQGRKP